MHHDPYGHRGLDRLTLFSDGVFAIAITLLAIEIRVPHVSAHATTREWTAALLGLVPSFLAFGFTFVVIGLLWLQHLQLLAMITRIDRQLLHWNLALLMAVSFLPFATSLLGEADPNPVPFAFYGTVLLATALIKGACTLSALRTPLLDHLTPPAVVRATRRSAVIMPSLALLALMLAFVIPGWNNLVMLGIPLLRRLRFFSSAAAR